MSNLLSVFGFEEDRAEETGESEPKPSLRRSCPRKAKEESTVLKKTTDTNTKERKPQTTQRKLDETPVADKENSTPTVKRKYTKRTGTNILKSVRKSKRNANGEDDASESLNSQNNRRSTRGHKPKSRFSPSKDLEAKNGKRKHHDNESKIEEQPVKKRKYTKRKTIEDKKTTDEKDTSQEKSDSSEASGSDTEKEEERSEGEEEEEEEEESSSSSEDDSEDDYMPTSTARRKATKKFVSPDGSTNDVTPKIQVIKKKPAASRRTYSKVAIKSMNEIPNTDEEVLDQIERGVIPDTVLYRASHNSMYIPNIDPQMIIGFGTNATVCTIPDEYFKYARARPKGKADYANPHKVREIIAAVRKRPIIWDQRLLAHQNTSLVRRAWISLDMELGVCDEYTLVRRKQIWKSKKDYYASSYITNSLQKWIFAQDMEFYEPMIPFRTLHSLKPPKDGEPPQNNLGNMILGNKRVKCTPDDKMNVLGFALKSIHEVGMTNPEMMENQLKMVQDIFLKNFQAICQKHAPPSPVEFKPQKI